MNPFRQINLQELSAKQKKIDINKNNKVDGEDLSALRKDSMKEASTDKMKKEETEQIDELDKKTLASYAFKAANQAADKTGEYEKRMSSAERAGARAKDGKLTFAKDANKALQQHDIKKAKEARAVASKRLSGLNKAVSKLAFKEDKDEEDKDKKSVDRLSRSDYKMSPSGRKSHKQIVFSKKMEEEVEIDESADAGLAGKAAKSGISIGTLRKVYRRGVAAWNSGHRPGTTPQQWGMARVNSYIGKGSGTYGGADKDLHEQTEELDEANHREFASQGKMHPDMAKNMSVGSEVDYYEPKTGDKVSGKVMHKTATAVHMKQTYDSYDPKKKGSVHKFSISSKLDEGSVPFDGPYTKTKPVKNSDGTVQTPMSRARELAKQALAKNKVKKEEIEIDEKINMNTASMGDVIKDFTASDAPQFKGKSDEKRRQMAVAAKLSAKQNEELHMHSFKSYIQEDMDESMFPGSPEYKAKFGVDNTRGKVGSTKKTPMGTSTVTDTGVKHERDYDKAEKQSSAPAGTEKRGRGRPAGASSGARQKGSAVKSDDRYDSTGYKLHLPARK